MSKYVKLNIYYFNDYNLYHIRKNFFFHIFFCKSIIIV
jgi:hypothetical protein